MQRAISRQPISLANPDRVHGHEIGDLIALEVEPDPTILEAPGFEKFGPVVTNRDFPAIIDEIRKQNREEFGPRADFPD